MVQIVRILLPVFVVALGLVPTAGSEVLYRWVDESGRLHLSDHLPPGDAAPVEQLSVPTYAPPELPPDQAPYSILNQLERLEASREKLARERWERQQREREWNLRQRELELRENQQRRAPASHVYAYPRPPYQPQPPHHPGRPGQYPPAWGLWQQDHPAYRPHPQPYPPVPRMPYGTEGFELRR